MESGNGFAQNGNNGRRGSKPTLLRSGRLNGKPQKEEGDDKKDDWEDEERIAPLALKICKKSWHLMS